VCRPPPPAVVRSLDEADRLLDASNYFIDVTCATN
jgi:hypothetical protein